MNDSSYDLGMSSITDALRIQSCRILKPMVGVSYGGACLEASYVNKGESRALSETSRCTT